MLNFVFGVFIILHGLVHLLYFGQSQKYFELQPGMSWPAGSWAFSRLLGDGTTRSLTSLLCVLVAVVLVTGGIGFFAKWGSMAFHRHRRGLAFNGRLLAPMEWQNAGARQSGLHWHSDQPGPFGRAAHI